MLCKSVVSLAFAASALANVFITSPTASSTFTAGQPATLAWQDDGKAPSLLAFGAALIGIYAGNANQQTLLQTISSSLDVSTTSSVNFTPTAGIGPNSNEYFIRMDSLSLKDANNTKNPAQAFSAKFTLTDMSGSFNSTLQAEINGQSTAPIGGSAMVSTSAAANGASSAAKTSSPGAQATSTSQSSGAAKIGVMGITCFLGVAGASLVGALIF